MATTADFRTGMVLEIDGQLYQLTYFQHVKPGKGGAFVRSKLKNVMTGAVTDRTWNAGERVKSVRLERRRIQFSYADGHFYHFMDMQTYDDIMITDEVLGEDQLKYLKDGMECEGLLHDGTVLMVGGGNSALTDALYLKNLGADVHIVHRRDEFRAEKALQDSVDREGIPVIRDGVVEEILGADGVEGAKLRNVKSDKEKTFKADAVFVAIGEIPHNRLAKDIGLNLSEEGYIDVDRNCRTNIPRVYAAGDITGGVRQIVTAVSEGAVAALSAFEDLQTPYWKKEAK